MPKLIAVLAQLKGLSCLALEVLSVMQQWLVRNKPDAQINKFNIECRKTEALFGTPRIRQKWKRKNERKIYVVHCT